jgi:hypothetical protein
MPRIAIKVLFTMNTASYLPNKVFLDNRSTKVTITCLRFLPIILSTSQSPIRVFSLTIAGRSSIKRRLRIEPCRFGLP